MFFTHANAHTHTNTRTYIFVRCVYNWRNNIFCIFILKNIHLFGCGVRFVSSNHRMVRIPISIHWELLLSCFIYLFFFLFTLLFLCRIFHNIFFMWFMGMWFFFWWCTVGSVRTLARNILFKSVDDDDRRSIHVFFLFLDKWGFLINFLLLQFLSSSRHFFYCSFARPHDHNQISC